MRIALVGNPNAGKSSVFNRLTGLRQKTGNYPGVTVDKKVGYFTLEDGRTAEITDLPGTYSIYARSNDERVVINQLLVSPAYDLVVVVADATNLRRHLLLFTQIRDLGVKTLLLINMYDLLEDNGWKLDVNALSLALQTPVTALSARTGSGFSALRGFLGDVGLNAPHRAYAVQTSDPAFAAFLLELQQVLGEDFPFRAWQYVAQPFLRETLSPQKRQGLEALLQNIDIQPAKYQTEGISQRFKEIDAIVDRCLERKEEMQQRRISRQLDSILVHPVFGFAVFFGILLLIFQAIFSWSSIPMDAIDTGMAGLGNWLRALMPSGFINSLITDGLLPGLTGIVIFIPQIALLFLFISLLEESGYMARVVFIMDRLLRPFGLNGKSVVPLISGAACAIPAIMAARTIENEKERLLTILVTPFITCSARLPIYVILIALVIPPELHWIGISLQAWALMGLYILGAMTALGASWVIDRLMRKQQSDGFVMEMPLYKMPQWKNVALTMYERSMAFVLGAGKIILSISLLLWVLASFGPNDKFYNPEKYMDNSQTSEAQVAAYKLEHSFIGYFGKGIEPVIKPLGYNWKIGIALLTSFAAREVFVGTMATIYGLSDAGEDNQGIMVRMRQDTDPATGTPVFSLPVVISLLLFYAFAMQCMSTLAIVKRELKSWKYPLLQLVFMTGLAYVAAWAAFVVFK